MNAKLLGFAAAAGAVAAASMGAGAQKGASRPIFNVLDYGAKKDASTPATEAFRQTMEAAKKAGGGMIFVPAGQYISGPIELYSNVTLDVDAGATIAFPVAPLPFAKGRYLGVEALVPMPLISASGAENVTITGRGTLTTGDYEAWGKAYGASAAEVGDESRNAN